MKLKIALALALFLIVLGTGFIFYSTRDQEPSFALHLLKAEDYLEKGDYLLAYGHFNRASRLNETDGDLQWRLARLSVVLGRQDAAKFHGEAAWDLGVRDVNMIRMFLSHHKTNREKTIEIALSRLDEIPDSYEKNYFRGELYFNFGMYLEALQIWNELMKQSPNELLAWDLINVQIKRNKIDAALEIAEQFRERNLLDEYGYLMLMNLHSMSGSQTMLQDILDEAEGKSKVASVQSLRRVVASSYFLQGAYTGAIQLYQKAVSNPGLTFNSIKNWPKFLVELRNKERYSFEVLNSFSEEFKKEIEAYQEIDLPSKSLIKKTVKGINAWLSNAVSSQDFQDKRSLLKQYFPDKIEDVVNEGFYLEAHMYLAYCHYALSQIEELANLKIMITESPDQEILNLVVECLLSLDKNLNHSYDCLRKIKLLEEDRHAVVSLVEALIFSRQKKFDKASEVYEKLLSENVSYNYSATIITDLAKCYILLGEYVKANILLADLHSKNIYSKTTLSMVRDLSTQGYQDFASETQEILELQFNDDEDVALGGVLTKISLAEIEEARKAFDALDKKNIAEEHLMFAKYTLWFREGRYEDIVKEVTNKKVKKEIKTFFLARSHNALGNYSESIKNYEAFLALEPRLSVEKELALAYLSGQQYEKAEKKLFELQASLERDPDIWAALAYIARKDGRKEESKKYLKQILSLDLYSEESYLLIAKGAMEDGDYESAMGTCGQLLTKNPDFIEARVILALSLLALGEWGDASKQFEFIISKEPKRSNFYWELMVCHTNMGQLEKALGYLEQYLSKGHDEDEKFVNSKLTLLLESGKIIEAKSYFESKKTKLKIEDSTLYQSQFIEMEQGVKEAISFLQTHLSSSKIAFRWLFLHAISNREPDLSKIKISDIEYRQWATLGLESEKNRNSKMAIWFYEHANKAKPNDPVMLNNIAWNNFMLGQVNDDILNMIEKAYQLQPNNLDIIDSYAKILIRLNKYAQTIELLEKHSDLLTGVPSLLYDLAFCYEKEFKMQIALRHYETVLSLMGNSKRWSLPISKEELQKKVNFLLGL